jgi:hypothetical protein
LTAIEAELKEESWLDGYGKLHCYAYKYYYSKLILQNNAENGHVGTLTIILLLNITFLAAINHAKKFMYFLKNILCQKKPFLGIFL